MAEESPLSVRDALESDPQCFFICDRRDRSFRESSPINGGFLITSIWKMQSPMGNDVWIARARLSPGWNELPKIISLGLNDFSRILDRFYLPLSPDPSVSIALFDVCAESYDSLINCERNLGTIKRLMEFGFKALSTHHATILDFGCGSGLSSHVARQFRNGGASLLLYGTDGSPNMLTIAAERGIKVLSASEWMNVGTSRFDMVISSYVLHYGITDSQLRILWEQLNEAGVLIANYYQGSDHAVVSMETRLKRVGFKCEQHSGQDITEGTIFVCRK